MTDANAGAHDGVNPSDRPDDHQHFADRLADR